jgi:branched-subunit amino acid aminotransferase/4-amino-4-deoxychorismate lyase
MKSKLTRKSKVYLSGHLISFDQIISPLSLYAYGAFTTIKYTPEGLLFLDKHFERLKYNCRELNIKYPSDEKIIEGIISALNANHCRNKDAIVRVTLFPESINWNNPQFIKDTPCAILVTTREMYYLPQNFKLKTVNLTRNMPHLKTINYTVNMLAKAQAREAGYHDGLFLNQKGNITEGTAWNIFFIKNNKIYTPPLDSGILEGITRGAVIDICQKLDIELITEDISLKSINNYEAAFITNASQGPHAVLQIDETDYDIENETFLRAREEYSRIPLLRLPEE